MLIIANWKAYIDSFQEAQALVASARRLAGDTEHTIVLAPPAPFIGAFALRKGSVAFAVQDISATTGGAMTGEITAAAAHAAGASYVIVGHSERRALGENDAAVGQKLTHAIAHDLTPVLCIGEHERDSEGRYLAIVRDELTRALMPLSPKERTHVVVAYEPLWAIGKTAADALSGTDLAEMVLYIRKVLAELLPGKSAALAEVLYGGSVESANVRALAGASGVSGFLVGHASVEPAQFRALVRALS